ncbi:MAG: transcriptional regulator NrdR [Victivallaceae bacterium]|jgi:transcriptional repressor NrdR|nr:transcriptional regulator NrdR [Victivallaceae bacterium]
MRCPECHCHDDKVIDSRVVKEGAGVRRRRECLNCAHRFTTYEGIIQPELKVIKRETNAREDFDRDKLRHGIENACYKRPVPIEDIDRVVDDIYTAIQQNHDKEISSMEIGRLVMDNLRDLDQVAYVRFASVYRKFTDIDEFIDEIRSLR